MPTNQLLSDCFYLIFFEPKISQPRKSNLFAYAAECLPNSPGSEYGSQSLSVSKKTLRAKALELGFDHLGVTSALPPTDYSRYLDWVQNGYAGDMWYLTEASRIAKRGDLQKILPSARSVIVGAFSYAPKKAPHQNTPKIARYAWGEDYHPVVKEKLEQLATWLKSQASASFEYRIYVDTGPILERSLAERAGVGWIGKNTCIISGKSGSYHLLGVIITTLDLPADVPATNHCGTCTRCLDACPTDAFVGPYQLDAQRCISYQTLENRKGTIPAELAKNFEGWIAGCDICQEVCPWNRKPTPFSLPQFAPGKHMTMDRRKMEGLGPVGFARTFKNTALERTGWSAFFRNLKAAFSASPVAIQSDRGMIPPT